MTAIGKEEQTQALAKLLSPLGFKKHRATWHRAFPGVIQVVNLQASQWGLAYYVNVGTYLSALGEETTPPEFRCHVRARIDPPDRPAEVLVHECDEWFKQYGSVASLAARAKQGSLPISTTAKAREWLAASAQEGSI